MQDLPTFTGTHLDPARFPGTQARVPSLRPSPASQRVGDVLPADQGLDETQFDLHYATSLSTDSTQARD